MTSGPLNEPSLLPLDWIESEAHVEPAPSLDVEIDAEIGTLRVFDPRLFRNGRRVFCERLLQAAAAQFGVRRADVDLTGSSCVVEFDWPEITPELMAQTFVKAVRDASGSPTDEDLPRWRRPRDWSSLAALNLAGESSLWEVQEEEPGSLQLRRHGLTGDRRRLARLADQLAEVAGVEHCRVSTWSPVIRIQRRVDGPSAVALLEEVERFLRSETVDRWLATPSIAKLSSSSGDAIPLVAGWKRLTYLALAGGSFTLTLVGLVVPGVPTVPFLMATGYYLARSSPALNDRLRRAAFFGPILREAETHGELSLTSKGKLTALTAVTVAATIVILPITPLMLIIILGMSSLTIHGIARVPTLHEVPQPKPVRLAVVAP